MKRTGPPKKPTILKLLAGTYRADRAPRKEAKPRAKTPNVPDHVVDEAQAEWKRVTKELSVIGLLTRVDRGALAAYCTEWATYVHACEMLRRPASRGGGMVLKSKDGNLRQSPWILIKDKALGKMHRYLTEFGMTPASRSRINVLVDEAYAKVKDRKNFA